MKYIRVALVVLLAVSIFGAFSQARAGAFTYTSGINVQNLESSNAGITLIFYDSNGNIETSLPDTLLPNGSKTYFPLNMVSDGFNGSVVISSDRQIAAISNVLGDGGNAAAAYRAADVGSTQVSVPLLMKNNSGYNTWFNVQNTGAVDANVTVTYSDSTTDGGVIKPGAAKTFDQLTDGKNHPRVFSAIVTSDQPVAAAAIEENTKVMFAYSGFQGSSTAPVIPLVNANNAGYVTGITIQNLGSSSTDVTLSYVAVPNGGTNCTETQTIPAKQTVTFAFDAFRISAAWVENCANGVKFVGSASVTANSTSQPLNAIVNQLSPANGGAYNAFDPAGATSRVVFPLIMDRNSGWWTSINMQNVGSTATTVTCTFTNTAYQIVKPLNPGEGFVDLQNNKIANKYVGAATCTASASGKIVGVVNELGPNSSLDQLLVYEGINTP